MSPVPPERLVWPWDRHRGQTLHVPVSHMMSGATSLLWPSGMFRWFSDRLAFTEAQRQACYRRALARVPPLPLVALAEEASLGWGRVVRIHPRAPAWTIIDDPMTEPPRSGVVPIDALDHIARAREKARRPVDKGPSADALQRLHDAIEQSVMPTFRPGDVARETEPGITTVFHADGTAAAFMATKEWRKLREHLGGVVSDAPPPAPRAVERPEPLDVQILTPPPGALLGLGENLDRLIRRTLLGDESRGHLLDLPFEGEGRTFSNPWDGTANTDPIANLHTAIENSELAVQPIVMAPFPFEVLKIGSATWDAEIARPKKAKYIRAFLRAKATVQPIERVPETHREAALASSIFHHETRRWRRGRRTDHPTAAEALARAAALCRNGRLLVNTP